MSASVLQRQIVHKDPTRPHATLDEGLHRQRKKGKRAARLETRPPPLPPNYKGHLQFYGFPVNEDWIMQYAVKHREPPKDPRALAFWPTLGWFLRYLRFESNFSGLNLEGALLDDSTPPDATVRKGETGIPQINVIYLTAWEHTAWANRPTMAQIEIMSDIMGIQPRWFTDVNSLPPIYD